MRLIPPPLAFKIRFALFIFIASFFVSEHAHSQVFGGNPPAMRWRQIDTDIARIIYPVPLEKQAQRVSNITHYMNRHVMGSVGHKHKKINIVLQNKTVVPNGYVGLAPFRSEFYMTPPQSSYTVGTNWLDVLTIHEHRHVHQRSNSRRGLSMVGYVLQGELGWGFFSSLAVPNWYWEGDAVIMETALSQQGRGRMPFFYNGFKSLNSAKKNFRYSKVRNGSLKDYVPNHYESGYFMNTYGRENYQNDLWKGVLHDGARYKGLFYSFSRALRKRTGLSTTDFYVMTMRHYNAQWDSLKPKSNQLLVEQLNSVDKRNTYTVYNYPQTDKEGSIIAYKASYKMIGGFYKINKYGMEYLISRQGRVIDNYFSYKNGRLVWSEIGQDERWGWDVRSNIVLYDMYEAKRKRLNFGARYFSPDINEDGTKIIAFHSTTQLRYNLHILSGETGELIKEISNPNNYYFSYPKWMENEQFALAIARDEMGRNSIVKVDVENSTIEPLLQFTNHQIGVPDQFGNRVFFSASFSGTDNVYVVDMDNGKIHKLTDEEIGAYNPTYNPVDNKVYYNDFNYLGSDLKMMPFDTTKMEEVSFAEPVDMSMYDYKYVKEEGGDLTEKVDAREFPTKKYSNSSKLLNFHSWSIFATDPNYEWALRSNNILNTLDLAVGLRYNRNENNLTYFAEAFYSQLYPVFDLQYNWARRSGLYNLRDESGNVVDTQTISWWENNLKAGVSLPFNLSSGLYSRSLRLSTRYALSWIQFEPAEGVETTNFELQSVENNLTFINRRKKAQQNILSKWGQYLRVGYNFSIDDNTAEKVFVDSELSFPGLSLNHNIAVQPALQIENAQNDYRFTDSFIYSRGYSRPFYDYIYKVGTNYHLPLVYPDWGFLGILYFYRVRANVFFDYSRAHFSNESTNTESIQLYNSAGSELIFDTRIFNVLSISFGVRYSYLLNEDPNPRLRNKKHSYEFFIPLMRL